MKNGIKAVVIFHSPCTDGFTSAWIMHRFSSFNCEFVPASHGKPLPKIDYTGKLVYVLDFWLDYETLRDIAAVAEYVYVFDHHKTALEDYQSSSDFQTGLPNVEIVLDMGRSGAAITWDELVGDERPAFVDYVSDHDLFQHKLPESVEISAAVQTYEFDFDTWDKLAAKAPVILSDEGRNILRINKHVALAAAKSSYPRQVIVDGLIARAQVANVGYPIAQDVLTFLREESGADLAIGFTKNPDGGWKLSARSNEHSPVTARMFCEKFGGGGHEHASGANVVELPAELL
mgnify:CR=1 FL=1